MTHNDIDDDYIVALGKAMKKNNSDKTVKNAGNVAVVKLAYNKVKEIVSGNAVSVRLKLHKPFNNDGAIIVRGTEITIKDTDEFVKIARGAQLFDVYSELDGHVVMTFSYSNLARR